MRCGSSDSKAGDPGFVVEVYQELLALQIKRRPFDVCTGKRAYTNILIESLAVTTDQTTEHALKVIAGLREVIITSTEAMWASEPIGMEQGHPVVSTLLL